MNLSLITSAGAILLLGIGVGLGYFIRQLVAQQRKSSIEAKLKKLIEDSRAEAKETMLVAKENAAKILDEAKKEEKERILQLRRMEERVVEKERTVDRRMGEFETKEKEFDERVEKLKAVKLEIEEARNKAIKELERVSGLSREDAVKEIMV